MDKGLFKIAVSLWAMVTLILVFLIFLALFSFSKPAKNQVIDTYFSAIEGPLDLEVFLQSPAGMSTQELGLDYDYQATNADLISLSCTDNQNQAYRALVKSSEEHFGKIYSAWGLEITYFEMAGNDLVQRRTDRLGNPSWLSAESAVSHVPCLQPEIIAKVVLRSSVEQSKLERFKFK